MQITSVGSFPKTKDAREGKIREATEWWIRKQEELGYDVLVHGEQERDDMVAYFGENIVGMSRGGEPVRSYGNRFWIPPEIVGKVHLKAPMTVDSWKYAQSITQKPIKGMLTGPGTIYDWSIDSFYGNRERAVIALAGVLHKEVETLVQSGAKYVQIDEPSIAQNQDMGLLREAFEIMTKGIDAYFFLHTCYGEDIFEKVYPELLKFPVHNLDLEFANNDMRLLEIIRKYSIEKDITAGVVDVHSHDVEDYDTVKERVQKCLDVIPREKLWLGPDCGLKTRTIDEAVGKLRVISEISKYEE
jgi:5-methyltetrahydropteroyltriglutamate--homocysteine methyltransferase